MKSNIQTNPPHGENHIPCRARSWGPFLMKESLYPTGLIGDGRQIDHIGCTISSWQGASKSRTRDLLLYALYTPYAHKPMLSANRQLNLATMIRNHPTWTSMDGCCTSNPGSLTVAPVGSLFPPYSSSTCFTKTIKTTAKLHHTLLKVSCSSSRYAGLRCVPSRA